MVFGGKDKKSKAQARPAAKVRVELETILGANTSLKGDLRSSGSIRIDGDFEGTIDTVGNVIVGEAARVVATVSAHNVQIQGTVQGDVTARRIEVLENGIDIRVGVPHQPVCHEIAAPVQGPVVAALGVDARDPGLGKAPDAPGQGGDVRALASGEHVPVPLIH